MTYIALARHTDGCVLVSDSRGYRPEGITEDVRKVFGRARGGIAVAGFLPDDFDPEKPLRPGMAPIYTAWLLASDRRAFALDSFGTRERVTTYATAGSGGILGARVWDELYTHARSLDDIVDIARLSVVAAAHDPHTNDRVQLLVVPRRGRARLP